MPKQPVAQATPEYGDRRVTPSLGRRRDPTRDVAILNATLDLLVEIGFDAMSMDMVAERARAGKATLYRRWSSKVALTLDAVAHMTHLEVDVQALPDTGSLRADMLALIRPESLSSGERRLKIRSALGALIASQADVAQAINAASVQPWIDANRVLIQRAVDRGEFASTVEVEMLAHVVPSLAAYRVDVQRKSLDRAFIVSLIDGVLMPALRGAGLNH